MAQPITWRTIEAPDFRTAFLGLNQAQQSLNNAFVPLQAELDRRQQLMDANWANDRNNNANDLRMQVMSQFKTPEAYQAALADGTVDAMLSRYQNIDKGKALDFLDARGGVLRQRALDSLNYQDKSEEVALRPLAQAAKTFVANNDKQGFMSFMEQNPLLAARMGGDLAQGMTAAERAAAAEARAAAAEGRAVADQRMQEELFPDQRALLRANTQKALAEAAWEAAGGGRAGAAARAADKEMWDRVTDKAKKQIEASPLAKGFLGEPQADDYVREGVTKLFGKDSRAVQEAMQLVGKYTKDGVTMKGPDGKETRYQVPAATMLKIIEQNLGKLRGNGDWNPFNNADPKAVGTALEEMFKDNNYLQTYTEGYRARQQLTDMDNLGSIPGTGGGGGGVGGYGGSGLAPLNTTNNASPTVPMGGRGRGDPPPGSGLVPVSERIGDRMDNTAEDIADLRRELANAKSPEIRTVLQDELNRRLAQGVKPTPDNSTGAIARDVVANMLAVNQASGGAPAGAAAPAAPAGPVATNANPGRAPSLAQASAAAMPAPAFQVNQDMEAKIAREQMEAASGTRVRFSDDVQQYQAAKRTAEGAAARQAEFERTQRLNGPKVNAPWSITETNRQPTAAEAQALKDAAAKALAGSPSAPRPGTGERPGIYAGETAWMNYRNEQNGNQSAAESTRLANARSVPNVNTRGEVTGPAPTLPATALVPRPSQVSASTSFRVDGKGVVADAPPVEIPKDVKLGKAETVVAPKKTAKDFMGQANTAVITYVDDGDTAKLDNGLTCRIDTIDAQETPKTQYNPKKVGQPYGEAAKQTLKQLIDQKEVEVRITAPEPDKNGRYFCQISVAGKDVDVAMVQAGAAELYREFIQDKKLNSTEQAKRTAKAAILDAAEQQARADKVGQWALPNYERPSAYRRRTE